MDATPVLANDEEDIDEFVERNQIQKTVEQTAHQDNTNKTRIAFVVGIDDFDADDFAADRLTFARQQHDLYDHQRQNQEKNEEQSSVIHRVHRFRRWISEHRHEDAGRKADDYDNRKQDAIQQSGDEAQHARRKGRIFHLETGEECIGV